MIKWVHKHFPQLAEGSLRSARVSDLFDNLHCFLRLYRIIILLERYRNRYCLNFKEFNSISQSYHSSLSYIKEQKQSPGGILRNFAKVTKKNTCAAASFLIKLQVSDCKSIKKRLWHRCFPVNFAKFLRTIILTEHLRWLLLKGRFDFQIKGLQIEREKERFKEYGCRQKQYYNIQH